MQDGEFIWDKETQGIILGAFFYGYLVTQLPVGILAQNFGGKRVLGYFLLVASAATLLCGVGARFSPYMLIFLRVVIGMASVSIFNELEVVCHLKAQNFDDFCQNFIFMSKGKIIQNNFDKPKSNNSELP